jgi:hypothetical protein
MGRYQAEAAVLLHMLMPRPGTHHVRWTTWGAGVNGGLSVDHGTTDGPASTLAQYVFREVVALIDVGGGGSTTSDQLGAVLGVGTGGAFTAPASTQGDLLSLRDAWLLDTLGACAQCVGRSAFGPLLPLALFPILERVADDADIVRQAALATLVQIAKVVGSGSGSGGVSGPSTDQQWLSALLGENMDYLVDGVCQRLPLLSAFPNTVGVVDCLARCCDVQDVAIVQVRPTAGRGVSCPWQSARVSRSLLIQFVLTRPFPTLPAACPTSRSIVVGRCKPLLARGGAL